MRPKLAVFSHQYSIAFTVESTHENGELVSKHKLLAALLRRVAEIASEAEDTEAYQLLDSDKVEE